MRRGVWTLLFFLFVSLFLCSIADAEIAMRYGATGEAGFGKDIFKFKSAIAKWEAQEKKLEVGFFPFDVTDEDAKKVSEWHMMFYATGGKPSPNPTKWSSPPYIIVMMKFKKDLKTYKTDDIDAYGLNVVKVKGQSTVGVFLSESEAKEIVKAFQFSPTNLKSLKLEVDETKDRSHLEGFRYKAKLGGK